MSWPEVKTLEKHITSEVQKINSDSSAPLDKYMDKYLSNNDIIQFKKFPCTNSQTMEITLTGKGLLVGANILLQVDSSSYSNRTTTIQMSVDDKFIFNRRIIRPKDKSAILNAIYTTINSMQYMDSGNYVSLQAFNFGSFRYKEYDSHDSTLNEPPYSMNYGVNSSDQTYFLRPVKEDTFSLTSTDSRCQAVLLAPSLCPLKFNSKVLIHCLDDNGAHGMTSTSSVQLAYILFE